MPKPQKPLRTVRIRQLPPNMVEYVRKWVAVGPGSKRAAMQFLRDHMVTFEFTEWLIKQITWLSSKGVYTGSAPKRGKPVGLDCVLKACCQD